MNWFNNEKVEKLSNQITKYNQDFTYYFACLTTAHFQIQALAPHFKKASGFVVSKERSLKKHAKVVSYIKNAIAVNNSIIDSLEAEIKNLKQVVGYLSLDEHKPKVDMLVGILKSEESDIKDRPTHKSAVKALVEFKILHKNIALTNDYILPKNEAILNMRKGLQQRLTFKLNQLTGTTEKTA